MAHILPTNVTNFYDMFTYVNAVTEYWFFPMVLVAIWFVVFIATKRYETNRALLFSCIVCMIFAILLKIVNLVNELTLMLFIGATIGAFLLNALGGEPY